MTSEKIYICIQNGACKAYFSFNGNLIHNFHDIKKMCKRNDWDFDEILEYFGQEEFNFKLEDFIFNDSPFMIFINCQKQFLTTYHIPKKFTRISQITISPNEV